MKYTPPKKTSMKYTKITKMVRSSERCFGQLIVQPLADASETNVRQEINHFYMHLNFFF